jgi:hypothetical protein
MRTSTNIGLQAWALSLAMVITIATSTWFLLILVLTVVGVLVPMLPLILALVIRRRGRIGPAVQAPFVAAAAILVVAAAFRREDHLHAPALPSLRIVPGIAPSPAVEEALWVVGDWAFTGFFVALLWILFAMAATMEHSAAHPAPPDAPEVE